ncbi:O-antigen ligase family protein [Flaviflexus sp.]|uniref:O-antigen ligase family protein n=1 Tax=Flaviflexus sp. TaxID=1969482 RepID=UPI00352FCCD3
MVGLAALIIHDERIGNRGVPSSPPTSHALTSNARLWKRYQRETGASSHRAPGQVSSHGAVPSLLNYRVLLGIVIGLAGLLMSRASQASFFLAVVLVCASAVAIFWTAPPKWLSFLIAFLGVELAVIVVTYLGTRDSWPDWLSDGESLSSARHTLWSDALSLWSTNPAVGTGMGTFTASSELASSRADLAATHSLFLQVGAELGIIGVLLLTCLFGGVLYRCSPAARSAAFIGMMAWMCLGIHTSIDHLEDFPVVWLMAGAVLAWCRPHVASSGDRATRNKEIEQTQ